MKTFTDAVNLAVVLTISALVAAPVSATNVHSMRDKSGRGHLQQSFDFGEFHESRWQGKESYKKLRSIHSIFSEHDREDRERWSSRIQSFDFSKLGIDKGKLEDYISNWQEEHSSHIRDKYFFRGHGGFDKEVLVDYIDIKKDQNAGPSVVPIPPAAWLMISALGVLGWRGRQSAAKKQDAGMK